MKLKISISRHNGSSALARVEDGEDRDIELADCPTPKAACIKAAKALRDAAARFELLALESEPYQCKVHDRINRTKLTPNVELTGAARLYRAASSD
jgi:hypothetical protein